MPHQCRYELHILRAYGVGIGPGKADGGERPAHVLTFTFAGWALADDRAQPLRSIAHRSATCQATGFVEVSPSD